MPAIPVAKMPVTNTDPAQEADPRWLAVLHRDAAADDSFVFAVSSTGIFCRPSCPARRPRIEHVRFFAGVDAAEHAGYRACKRCRPDQASLVQQHAETVARLCRRIEDAEQPPSLAELAAEAGLSPRYLQGVFKDATGLTPRAYAHAIRAQRLRAGLTGGAAVTDALYAAGYQSSGRFYAQSDALLGMTPSNWRAGGAGSTIRFAVGQCSLGAILVACSERGVCAIYLGDEPDALARELQVRFKRARLIGADAEFEREVAAVIGFVDAPRTGLDLPLDVRGTAFQQRVWRALQAIPTGQTASYAEIAKRIGAPKSARAVARACAANPVAIAIPCHRVVRSDGDLSGYRWGVERKRALLAREARR